MGRLDDAIAAIDAVNAEDPRTVLDGSAERPAELVYGERMSAELARRHPEASDALRLAVRAQHIRRWAIPRADYPMDRAGYHAWRNALKDMHGRLAADIVTASGYDTATAARVASLVRKDNLKTDAEAQALEDTACLVFLSHYAGDFADKHDDAKLTGILTRTWGKMSKEAREAALRIDLPPRLAGLVGKMLSRG